MIIMNINITCCHREQNLHKKHIFQAFLPTSYTHSAQHNNIMLCLLIWRYFICVIWRIRRNAIYNCLFPIQNKYELRSDDDVRCCIVESPANVPNSIIQPDPASNNRQHKTLSQASPASPKLLLFILYFTSRKRMYITDLFITTYVLNVLADMLMFVESYLLMSVLVTNDQNQNIMLCWCCCCWSASSSFIIIIIIMMRMIKREMDRLCCLAGALVGGLNLDV